MTHTDLELLERYRSSGDPRPMDTLMTRHYPAVYRVVRNLVRDETDASDVAQSTFVRALSQDVGSGCRNGERFRGWLLAIAVNEVRQHWRRSRRRPRVDPIFAEFTERLSDAAESGDAVGAASRREFEQALGVALATFPAELREPVVLHYYEGLSYGAIAEVLGERKSTVQSRCERAIARLREYFRERGFAALLPLIGRYFPGVAEVSAAAAGGSGYAKAIAVALVVSVSLVSWFGWDVWWSSDEAAHAAPAAPATRGDRMGEDRRERGATESEREPIATAKTTTFVARREVQTTGAGTISGWFLHADGQRPVVGASVTVSLSFDHRNDFIGADHPRWFVNSYVTDAAGRFACDQLDPHKVYDLYLRHPSVGYRSLSGVRFPLGLARVAVGVVLTSPGFRIEGTVVGPDGRPAAGARVTVGDYRSAPSILRTHLPSAPLRGSVVTTAADGSFACRGLSAGFHRIVARKAGFAPGAVPELRIGGSGEYERVRIVLQRPAELAGRIVDGRGEPVAGADVEVLLDEQRLLGGRGYSLARYVGRTATDPKGRFAFADLPAPAGSTFLVNVAADGFEDTQRSNCVSGTTDLLLELARLDAVGTGPHVVVGRLALPGGGWKAGLVGSVEVSVDDKKVRCQSDGDTGRFLLRGVHAGRCSLRAIVTGYRPAEREIEVSGAATFDAGTITLDPGCTITGVVRDKVDGEPIVGATLHFASGRTVLTEKGRFRVSGFQRMPGSSYGSLTVRAPGYLTASPPVRLSDKAPTVAQDILLAPATEVRSIAGLVRDPTGRPVAGAKVMAYLVTHSVYGWRGGRTDPQGRFVIPGITDRSISKESVLLVRHPAFAAKRVPVVGDGSGDYSITLSAGRTVRGRVVDTAGRPVAGARVVATIATGGGAPRLAISRYVVTAVVDRSGRFVLDRVPSSRVCIQAFHPQCRPGAEGHAFVAPRGRGSVMLTLERGHPLVGRVVDEHGRSVRGAMVFAEGSKAGAVVTGGDGRFRIPAVFRAAVTLRVRGRGWTGVLREVTPQTSAVIVAKRRKE